MRRRIAREGQGQPNAEPEFDARRQARGEAGITADMTENPQARQDPGGHEGLFHAMMTHSPMAAWIVDIEGRYRYASPPCCRIFQVPTQDLVGKLISEIHPPELAERYLLGNRAAIEAGQPIESVQPGVLPDGSPGEYLVVNFPIRDGNGKPLLCGMALDITERRQIITKLCEANERLGSLAEEQAAHLRELAGELTHAEQRERDRLYELLHDNVQPLLVAARLSLSGLSTRTSPGDCLRVAAEACDHISQVIQVARTLSLQLSPPLIREHGLKPALESLRDWVKSNHRLEVDLVTAPNAEPRDLAMRLICFNAVRELLMNVVKHSGTTRVVVTIQRVGNARLQITVADRGYGFDPTAVIGGSGLAGIERRLKMVGGSLQIDSRLGQGTVATLSVPLRQVAAAAEEQPASRKPRREKRKLDAENIDR